MLPMPPIPAIKDELPDPNMAGFIPDNMEGFIDPSILDIEN
jgi:hypothetical protein